MYLPFLCDTFKQGKRDMLRRPMLFAAIGSAAAVLISYYAGIAMTAAVLGVFSLYGILHTKAANPRWRSIGAITLAAYCLGAASFCYEQQILDKQAEQLKGKSLLGEVKDCGSRTSQSGEEYLRLIVRTERGKVIAKCYDYGGTELIPGSIVRIAGETNTPEGRRNPGCFD